MAAEQIAGGVPEATLNSRLDAIDHLLLGCVPRGERMAIVASLEDRLRGLWAAPEEVVSADRPVYRSGLGPASNESKRAWPAFSAVAQHDTLQISTVRGTAGRRRSKLALVSGILGIIAAVLLCGTPIVYGIVALLAEALDETIAIVAIVAYVAMLLCASSGAIMAGIVALWRLRRRSEEVGGRGWAITGLCMGPIPLGLTSLIALFIGLQVLDSFDIMGATAVYHASAENVPVVGGPATPPPLASTETPPGAYPAPVEAAVPMPGMEKPSAVSSAPVEPQKLPMPVATPHVEELPAPASQQTSPAPHAWPMEPVPGLVE